MVNQNGAFMFTIPHKLATLFFTEEKLIKLLGAARQVYSNDNIDQYLQTAQHRLNQVEMLKRVEGEDFSSVEDHLELILEKLVGNPMHVYSLIKRFTSWILPLYQDIRSNPELATIAEHINLTLEGIDEFPTEGDMEGVTQSLARIQFAYRYDPVDIALGVVGGVATEARLTVADCFDIAKRRYSGENLLRPHIHKEYALAIEWAEAAHRLIGTIDHNEKEKLEKNGISKTRIEEFINNLKTEHDAYWKNVNYGNFPNEEFFISKFSNYDYLVSGRDMRLRESEELPRKRSEGGVLSSGFNIHDFYSLCRGEKLQDLNYSELGYDDGGQTCFFTSQPNPYFTLAPLKVEVLLDNPLLWIFRDILTELEMKVIKKKALAQFETAFVQDISKPEGDGKKFSNERTQASGWLWDQDDPVMYKLSKKTGKFTGLECSRPSEMLNTDVHGYHFVEAEAWQIGIYGPGGHYLPHYDSFEILDPQSRGLDNIWVGNRVATAMFYLSDLVGGYTAFPVLGKAATPSKGSAVFWFNLEENGNRDKRSLHGACPSALGIKWVSNKWIREGAQIWKDPCNSLL